MREWLASDLRLRYPKKDHQRAALGGLVAAQIRREMGSN
jgi:hypothetical protein